MSLFRTRIITLVIALLVCGGYAHELSEHKMPRCENAMTHDHSTPDGKSGCHHCTCHCPPTALGAFDGFAAVQVPVCIGYVAPAGEFAPEAMPLGIDHPPQLA